MAIADVTFLAAAVPAVILTGLSKGGFAGVGSLATPLLALVLPPVEAASVMLPILLAQDAFSVLSYRRTVDWRNIARLLPGAIVGIALGYALAAYHSEAVVSIALGAISMIFAARNLFGKAARNLSPTAPGAAAGWLWGGLSGFTSMISHSGSPPFQIYVMPQRLPRDLFVGTSVVFFALVNWIKVAPYLVLGQLNFGTFRISLLLMPLAIFATFVGISLVRRVDTERFYLVVYVLLGLIGAKLLTDGVLALA